MSQDFPAQIRITFKELTDTKHFLDNQPKVRNAPRHEGKMRNVTICDETKRLLIRDTNQPSKRLQTKHSKDTASYPSNHGILRIPKEINSILRSEDAKQRKEAVNVNTVQLWEKFNQLAFQLSDINRRKENIAPARFLQKAQLLCNEMCQLTSKILNSDIEFCMSHPVENELWYKGVYVVTELMRCATRQEPEYSREYTSFLTSTMDYYSTLISSVQTNYKFKLSIVDNSDCIESESEQRKIQRAVLSCHLSYLSLGDILRYQVDLRRSFPEIGVTQGCDWSTVTLYYQRAMQLFPNSGRAYNQLAIVSDKQFRYLDTIYFYVRCISAYKAIPAVRESLLHTFYDIERMTVSPTVKDLKRKTNTTKDTHKFENEVWILPESSVKQTLEDSKDEETHSDEENSPLAIFQKLCQDAYSSFLTIQGKFYTNIGIDTIPDCVATFATSLTSLLTNKCNQSFAEVLLRMQLITLFSLTNQITESKFSQIYKLNFLFSFHFLLLQAMRANLQTDSSMQSNALYFMPLLRVFVQWLRHNTETWTQHLDHFLQHKIWNQLICVVNDLKSVECDKVENKKAFLWEDQLLSGCVVTEKFINTKISWLQIRLDIQDRVSFGIRMLLIFSDLKSLCDFANFPLSFEIEEGLFVVKVSQTETESVDTNKVEENNLEENVLTESQDPNLHQEEKLDVGSDEEQNEFHILRCERNRLEAELHKQTIQLSKHKQQQQQQQTLTRHEITPKYIVPDTNCFLSHLELIQSIYVTSCLQLTVPLIVLQELQHLRRPISKSQKHLSSCKRAKDAYSWLMEEFSNPKKKIFALTIEGHLIESLYKQDFSTVRNKRNDDLILQSCVRLNLKWQIPDPDCIKSCVVLLTSDRNLRLKAVTQNLPAKSLKTFLTLMNISL